MSDVERNCIEQRPPIVLTASDRERLFALLGAAPTTVNVEDGSFFFARRSSARMLRQMISRRTRS